jgi:hypothetical protein
MKYTYSIAEGELVRNPQTKRRFRVLCLMGADAIVYDVDAPVAPKSVPPNRRKKTGSKPAESVEAGPPIKLAIPEVKPLSEVIQWPREQWVPDIRLPESFTKAEKRFHSRASGVVEYICQKEPDIYFPKKRAELIALAVAKFRLSQRTVWKYLRAYWRVGKNISALYSDLSNCGAAGTIRIAGSEKRGRPRSIWLEVKIGPGINVQPSDQPHIKRAMSWYKANPEKTLENAYHWMLDACFSGPFEKPDGTKAWGANPLTVMNFAQFEYHCKRYFDVITKERREAEKNKGGKIPRERHEGVQVVRYEVGSIAEIDGLHCNISLVSSEDRSAVLGGMVVFIIVEYVTGMVLGFSVGWDGEAYESFADALVKCTVDKVAWCAQYDIDIKPEDWPVKHWPQHFHADRGSAFMSGMADRLVEVMKPNPFATTPPMSPECKGIVENTVKLIKLVFSQMYPGTWLAKIGSQKRGVRSPHKDSAMTRDEFIRAFMKVVLAVNQKVRTTATQPQLVARGVPNTPTARYLDALITHRHRLRRLDPIQLAAQLMVRMNATVSDEGIYIGDELYFLPDDNLFLASVWFKQLAQDKAKVSFALNRETIDVGFLCLPTKGHGFIPCSVSARSLQFRGMSLHEVKMTRTRKNELNKLEEHKNLPGRVEHTASMMRDGKEAKAKTSAALGNIPNAERDIGNRRENRSRERALERQKVTEDVRRKHEASPPKTTSPESTAEENFDYPDIDDE